MTRVWSQVLIAYETGENDPAELDTPPAFLVFGKLHPHLANLMGKAGVRALILRALALANDEVACLRSVQVNAEGGLERIDKFETQFGSTEMTEGGVVLLARFLGLLVIFVGESLTRQLVSDIWPELSPNHSGPEKEVTNEKAKRNVEK